MKEKRTWKSGTDKEVNRKLHMMEIGSIYEINPATVAVAEESQTPLFSLKETEKYGKKNVSFTASGRAAIALALKSYAQNRAGGNKTEAGKKCLLPAYMCDTVFLPFQWEGWEIQFYHINKNLEADTGQLCRLMEQQRPDLLFIHPYYGVDTWKPMRSLLKEWRAQGICIMEDVTQSYYLQSAGREADYVVGSLRKWYSVPDGGFVASNELLALDCLVQEKEFTKKRLELLTEKWEYLYGSKSQEEKKVMKEEFLKKNREMEAWLDEHREIGVLSREAAGILKSEDEQKCKNRRNENYRYLWEWMEGKTRFWPMLPRSFGEDGKMAAPLYFPVYAKDRDRMQKFLTEHGIYAPVLWPVGKENAGHLTGDEKYIYSHMLALPMDQRYGAEEMKRLGKVLEEYEEQERNLS